MKRIINNLGEWDVVQAALTLQIADHFDETKDRLGEPLTFIVKRGAKTLEQLGYFHTEVLPGLTRGLFHNGDIKIKSEKAAKLWLKMLMKYGEWYEVNGQPMFDAWSFEDAKIDDLMRAIDLATDCAQDRGEYIAPPRSKPKSRTAPINNKSMSKYGTDKQFLDWLSYQPSCIDGSFNQYINGVGRNIACHVRRASNSGTAIKPEFSAVPMTDAQHKLQSMGGEAAVLTEYLPGYWTVEIAKNWFDDQAQDHLEKWKNLKGGKENEKVHENS